MANALVIVESPAKAKTIKKYLGAGYKVLASVGHIMDLPQKELGVDIENDFAPTYTPIRGKNKVLKEITDAAEKVSHVYLAPDPDREGEAIAWHIAEEIHKKLGKKKGPKIYRARFNEITSHAIKDAIKSPGDLNQHLFEAQQARRILDRLVGYQISPILWDKVRRGLSAGRVQSVAVRIVCEREAEIAAFVSKEYWSIIAKFLGSKEPAFEAKLFKIDGKEIDLSTAEDSTKIVESLKRETFLLQTITKKERKRHPTPPFITSKLQQEAARKLGFSAKKTMMLAQRLYEGVELGDEGLVGLITYMRTDSIRVADSALADVRDFIVERYGKDSLPEEPNVYKSKKGAQDAHEAVRPTSMKYTPEQVEAFLEKDMLRLYDLIWKRFVASQMIPAVFDQTSFDIQAGKRFLLRASGQVLRIPGFISVYMEGEDDGKEKDEEENTSLPDLKEGETLKLMEIEPNQHFTQPPPRYTEASLVKALEELGIGRPSTYASIMSVIQEKEYVLKDQNKFSPTELGKLITELLVASFPRIFDVGFTAPMEEELDEVEEGKRNWVTTLKQFYGTFETKLKTAKANMRDVKRESIPTEHTCEKCGKPMVIKWGRHGQFLACSGYPECRTTKEFKRTDEGKVENREQEKTDAICDKCGSPMVLKRGRFGEFLACSKYPECKTTRSIGTGVPCPNNDGGELVQRRSKRGKIFYSCNQYPKCTYAIWDKPIAEKCPECGHPHLIEKYSKKTSSVSLACPQKECGFKKTKAEQSDE